MGRVQDRSRISSIIERLHLVRVMLLVLLSGAGPVFGQTIGTNGVPGDSTIKPPVANYAGSANAPAAIPNPQTAIALTDLPAAQVNKAFPAWLHFGGEYQDQTGRAHRILFHSR